MSEVPCRRPAVPDVDVDDRLGAAPRARREEEERPPRQHRHHLIVGPFSFVVLISGPFSCMVHTAGPFTNCWSI